MNRCVLAGAGLVLGLLVGHANAQDSVLAEVYGQGVHAYFARDYKLSHEMLTGAIQQGSRDPRCYFYRGLAYASLGRPDEAEADFKAGAELEISSTERVFPVADSLQRIQGRSRMQIEKYRQSARLASHLKASQIQQARYEELKRNEQEVLRNPARPPVAAPDANTLTAPAAGGSDPFSGTAEAMPEKAPERPADPAVTAPPPSGNDPLGTGGGTPAPGPTPNPAPSPTPAPDDSKVDPFSDDKPAGGQPAPPPPAEKPAEDDPFK